ncbi:MAG: hypothetical protein JNM83_21025 [Myxococcales bacterium]|nr:hypothetical protein [Myxococcales bacterium]
MLSLPQIGPSEDLLTQLQQWQDAVDAKLNYAQQVAKADGDWSLHRDKQPMRDIEVLLEQMCCGGRRCAYCEDTLAHQIEHRWPKNLYPELVFDWLNFLYACGSCNLKKGSRFAVYPVGGRALLRVRRVPGAPLTAPPLGEMVFIDPRSEDPTQFFTIDLRGSFRIQVQKGLPARARERAQYTLENLPLNSDPLCKQRRSAYRYYRLEVQAYIRDRERQQSQRQLKKHRLALAEFAHQTVWFEMKRQQAKIADLAALFAQAPEALQW